MTVQEAAERLGVTERHIGRLLEQGKLIGQQIGPQGSRGVWTIDPESVEAYAASNRKRGPKGPRPGLRPSKSSTVK